MSTPDLIALVALAIAAVIHVIGIVRHGLEPEETLSFALILLIMLLLVLD